MNFNAREAALLVAVGRWVSEMRLVPFTETIEAALDKVRAALGPAGQRELAQQMATLHLVGIPARAGSAEVRRVLEQAWFERRPMRIRYRDADGVTTRRAVRVRGVVMERTETLLNCDDLDKGQPRQFKLDRIEHAEIEVE